MANTKASTVYGVNENGEIVATSGTGSTTVKGFLPHHEIPVDDHGRMVIAGLGSGGTAFSKDSSGNITGILGSDGNNYGGIVLRAAMTGGANDAAAINAAINAVSVMNGGGVVEIPAGNWKVAGVLMKSNIWLRGMGQGVTVLKQPDNNFAGPATNSPPDTTNIIFAKASGSDLVGFRISSMTLDGNRTTQLEPNGFDNGQNCICVRGSGNASAYVAKNFLIEDVEVKSAVWHGIAVYDGARDFTINRVHGWDNGYRGMHAHSSDTSGTAPSAASIADARYRVMNCNVHDNGVSLGWNQDLTGYQNSGIFVALNNETEIVVTGNMIYNEVGPGIDIAGVDGVAGNNTGARFSIFTDNTITNCGDGVKVGGGADSAIIANNTIRNCTNVGRPSGAHASVAQGAGVSFSSGGTLGGSNIKVRGNIITGCTGWGVSTANASNRWKNIEISGNHVFNNSVGSTSTTSYGGIMVQYCDNVLVSGNICRSNANLGTADRQLYVANSTIVISMGNSFDASLKYDGSAYGNYPAVEVMSTVSGMVFTDNYIYRNGSGNGYNFYATNSTHFNNTGDKCNTASLTGAGTQGPKFNQEVTGGAGSAALGANCPAVTATAPYSWVKVATPDGSAGYVPVWK